jgi:hypothetical protein
MSIQSLQKHQAEAVEHIIAKCHKQRFTLLWHEMGTGKTLTGLAIAMSLPKTTKCTIVVPSDVLQPWLYHMDALKVPPNRISLITFENMPKALDLKDHVVIVDEAHNIIVQLMKDKHDWDVVSFRRTLRDAQKVVFMTGTPIVSTMRGISDLMLLVNAGSGTESMPVQKAVMEKQYFYIPDRLRQIIVGKMIPMLQTKPLFYMFLSSFISAVVFQLSSAALRIKGTNSHDVRVQKDILLAVICNLLPMVMTIFPILIQLSSTALMRSTLSILDSTKMAKDVRDVILPFRIMASDENYPKVTIHDKNVLYSQAQINTLVSFMDNVLDEAALKHFFNGDIDKMNADPKLLAKLSKEDFIYRSVSVGNMIIDGVFPPKFFKVYENMGARSVVWSQFLPDIVAFEKFLKVHAPKCRYDKIWKSMSFKDITSVLEKFKQGKYDVILLHPDMYQGISIHGATDMHVLEPCIDVMKYSQVKARVSRFHSHMHLPPSERSVIIYNWRCSFKQLSIVRVIVSQFTLNLFKARPQVDKALIGHTKKFKPHLHYETPDLHNSHIDISPDDAIFAMEKMNDTMSEGLREKLIEMGSACKDSKLNCCIWNPQEALTRRCVASTKLPLCCDLHPTKGLNGGSLRPLRRKSIKTK